MTTRSQAFSVPKHVQIGASQYDDNTGIGLTFVDPTPHNLNYPPPCMEGAHIGILNEIYDWLNDFGDCTPNIMWITGILGSGKSAIASSLASRLGSKEQNRLGSFYNFNQNPNALDDPNLCWESVATDLAMKYPCFHEQIAEILYKDNGSESIKLQFKHLIFDPLVKCKDKLKSTPPVVIFDSLDNCKHPDSLHSLNIGLNNWVNLPKQYKLVFTGVLGPAPPMFQNWMVCKIIKLESDTHINKNINFFLRKSFQIQENRTQFIPSEDELCKMTKRAEGLFIWASTAVKYITMKQEINIPLTHKIQEVVSGLRDNEMDNFYIKILDNSFGQWPDRGYEIIKLNQVLGMLCLAKSPLSLPEIEKLAITDRISKHLTISTSKILQYLQPLTLNIDGGMVFYHLSFKEYLTEQCKDVKYYVNIKEQTERITNNVFCVLNEVLEFNICKIETSYQRHIYSNNLYQKIEMHVPRYLQYCCKYWHMHYMGAVEALGYPAPGLMRLNTELQKFFYSKFLYWLEVMSLLNELPRAIRVLNEIKPWVKVFLPKLYILHMLIAEKNNIFVYCFIEDGVKFIKKFYTPISESIPHIYISALAFEPKESKISKAYLPLFRGLPVINRPKNTRTLEADSGSNMPKCFNCSNDWILSVVYIPDGEKVISGSYNGALNVWDVDTGKITATFEGHSDCVSSVTISADGRLVASGSYDNMIRIWNMKKTRDFSSLCGHSDGVSSVAFSPDSTRLASGSFDNTLRIWDVKSGKTIFGPFHGHTDCINSVAYSSNGKLVVSGSDDKTVRIWNIHNNEEFSCATFKGHTGSVLSVGFSPNAEYVASGSDDKTIKIWNIETGKITGGPFIGHTEKISSISFSPNGKLLVSGSHDATVRVWDLENGEKNAEIFKGHNDWVTSVQFSPDGRNVVSGSADKTIQVWNIINGKSIKIC